MSNLARMKSPGASYRHAAHNYAAAFELTRGETIESLHHASIAVVDSSGNLLAWHGDPDTVTFLRSSAKPFQALPFVECGAVPAFDLSLKELAVMCASHSGTDEHVATVRGIQAKTGVSEAELLCGVHDPGDEQTLEAMRERKEKPTPIRHNCSGKHSAMLAFTRLAGERLQDKTYIDPQHPIQQAILKTFAEMCALPLEAIHHGTDGCSAPNYAVPLRHAALAYARLCDPLGGGVAPAARADACQLICRAMCSHPDMVGGPGRFDTRLMQAVNFNRSGLTAFEQVRIIAKGGAEGYQGIGLMPDVLGPGSLAVGIALKIADGDARGKVRAAVAIEVLRQIGALSPEQLNSLADMGPSYSVFNWREILVGKAYPTFTLQYMEKPQLEVVEGIGA